MGPLATDDLFRKIITHEKASIDQEHLRICIDSNTAIADRTAALLHGGADPVPEIIKSAKRLESIGADMIVMPCNTAHNYFEKVQESVHIPILNMIKITYQVLLKKDIKCVGLLATDGTIKTGIYQRHFDGGGIRLLCPEGNSQKAVMDIIYNGIKAGKTSYDTAPIQDTINKLMSEGAKMLILGCTELPLAFKQYKLDYPCIDPTLELAKAAICFAGGKLKE